ncbi:MAG: PQQ-binding-like beta-propeller repeat protein [Bryobacteraceae bacterium]
MRRLSFAFCALAGIASSADWTRYRGDNGAGVAQLEPGAALPLELGKETNVLWKTAVPKGHSSPIVVGGKVVLTAYQGDERITAAYDAAKGSELWRASIAKARSEPAHPLNGPATPTPASDGENVYVFFQEFGLVSYTLEGKERWRRPLGPFASIQGHATSPIVAGGLVVLLIDQPLESFVAAYDSGTGEERWKAIRPNGFLGGYSTPLLHRPKDGPAQVIVGGARELTGYQLQTGERLWWGKGITAGPAASPILDGDTIYTLEPPAEPGNEFTSMLGADKNKDGKLQIAEELGKNLIMVRLMTAIDKMYGNSDGTVESAEWNKAFAPSELGGGLVATRIGPRGELPAAASLWKYTKGIPYVTSALLEQGVLYFVKNGGILTAIDAATGKVIKQGRLKEATGEFYASPVAAGGYLYFADKDGKLAVVKAGRDWEVISTGDLEEQLIATPAIAGGRLFVRTEESLYCFAARSKSQ